MLIWTASIALSVCFLVVAAAVGAFVPQVATAHLFIAGLMSTAIALLAFHDARKLIVAAQSDMLIAGTLMRYMGLIWAWLALVISVTYSTGVLEWSAWWKFFIGFATLSGLCLFVSRILIERAPEGRDAQLLKISQYLGCATLFGAVTAIGVYGVNQIKAVPAIESGSWAADNVMFFSALALAAVSSYLLKAGANQAR